VSSPASKRAWREANCDRLKAYRETRRDVNNASRRARRATDPETVREKERARTQRVRAEARKSLGGRCACCGFDRNPDILQLDHIDPVGRKDGHFTAKEWGRAARGNVENLQLLCPNCHAEKTLTEIRN